MNEFHKNYKNIAKLRTSKDLVDSVRLLLSGKLGVITDDFKFSTSVRGHYNLQYFPIDVLGQPDLDGYILGKVVTSQNQLLGSVKEIAMTNPKLRPSCRVIRSTCEDQELFVVFEKYGF